MRAIRMPSTLPFRALLVGGMIVGALLGIAASTNRSASTAVSPLSSNDTSPPSREGPPWLYGRIEARFSVIEYADLECPYCRAYFPVLKRWVDVHPDVNWQWRHLPLAMHEPAATADARLAECAGEAGGTEAFWKTIAWIYANTRGGGQGLPRDMPYPDLTPAMQRCLASNRPNALIRVHLARQRLTT